MGSVLVIHPRAGLLELVKRVLAPAHAVEVCDNSASALQQLAADRVYDAVLCGLEEPVQPVEIFRKALERSATTRLIPIASSETPVRSFREQWDAATGGTEDPGSPGSPWLRQSCTAGEILALFKSPAPNPAAEIDDGPTESEHPALDLKSGDVINGYRLEFQIGEGGFGVTWLAVNETTDKPVAIKFVAGEEQLPQELAALRKYVYVADRSEHLIQIEHINQDPSRLWLVTPLAESMTGAYTADAYKPLSLQNHLQARGHLSEPDANGIAIGLVRALVALHHSGLLHGDVSPPNILKLRDRWVLADPGLIRFIGQSGTCRNRRYYPQPLVVHPRDDLYAVGVILWEMVSGVWEMASGMERIRLDGNMLTFISRKNLPLGGFICRAVAENPEQRYMTAEAMLHDLLSLADKLATEPGPRSQLYELLAPFRTS